MLIARSNNTTSSSCQSTNQEQPNPQATGPQPQQAIMLFKESLPSNFNPNQATQFIPGRPSSGPPSADTILPPPSDTLALWTRAIEHPETLTDLDRAIILSRHPLPETDALHQQACGLPLAALQDKAIDHPETLSSLECSLLRHGARDTKGHWDDPKNILRWPRETKLLRLGAVEIALTPRDRVAEKRAVKRMEGISERIFQARARLDVSRDVLNLKKAGPWAERLVEEAGKEGREVEWGFVGFRTGFGDEKAWERWRSMLAEGTGEALWLGKVPERLEGRWRVVWVEERALEGVGLEGLRERFQSICAAEGADALPSSISRHAFLYADDEAILSATPTTTTTTKPPMKASNTSSSSTSAPAPAKEPLTNAGWVWAVDPTLTAPDRLASSPQPVFPGAVKVSLIHVLTTFYARLDPSADPDDPTGARQAWEVVFAKARANQQEPGVYPPAASLN